MITYDELIEQFSIVYQRGHHNVYCNGKEHFRIGGGFCWPRSDQEKEFEHRMAVIKPKCLSHL